MRFVRGALHETPYSLPKATTNCNEILKTFLPILSQLRKDHALGEFDTDPRMLLPIL